MDPKLRNAIPWIIQQMKAQGDAGGFAAAADLQQYLASDGHTPLSPATLQLSGHLFTALGLPLPTPGTPAPGASPAPQGGAAQVAGPEVPPQQMGPPAPAIQTGTPPAMGRGLATGAQAATAQQQTTGTFSPDRGQPVGGPAAAQQTSAQTTGAFSPDRGRPVGTPTPSAGGNGDMPAGSGSSSVPGGFTPVLGKVLGEDDDALTRFAMQAAGFNPDIITPASQIAGRALAAMVKARRAAFGSADPNQAISGLPQDIAAFAKEFTTPGADFYGHARQYAQGLLADPNFGANLGGTKNQLDRYGMYQALTPLLFSGSNPMIQQSVSDQLGNMLSDYNLQSAQNPTQVGDILQFVRDNPKLSPLLRSIFGPATK